MGEPDDQTIAACARAWQTLRLAHDRVARRLGGELARECGLTISEFDALLFLRSHGDAPVRFGALLDAVPLSQPALSRLVARLEGRGLVARSGTAADRRTMLISLTEAGAALIDRASAVHARVVHETLTSRFSPAEQEALRATLSQIGR
jgi:DNA-binding MarR family transcriptional regulator